MRHSFMKYKHVLVTCLIIIAVSWSYAAKATPWNENQTITAQFMYSNSLLQHSASYFQRYDQHYQLLDGNPEAPGCCFGASLYVANILVQNADPLLLIQCHLRKD